MRILMFGMSSYPGGIENYIFNLFAAKDFPQDIQIDFITYEPELAYEEQLVARGYRVHRVPYLKKHPFGYYCAVKKLIKENAYDSVYINMLTAANVLPIFLASRFGIRKIILHAHANSTINGALRKTLHRVNKRYCNKKATLRLACSEQAGKWLFDNRDFFVIANAIDTEKFCFSKENRVAVRRELSLEPETFVLGHIGRIAPEKNHTFMLDILQRVCKCESNTKLVFVGDGALLQAVKEKASALGLAQQVIFYGTSSETYKLYSAFDCFLFPSTFEGFGMAALEAQACGLQCYCSNSLAPELNVSGAVEYLPLSAGAQHWAEAILAGRQKPADTEKLHQSIEKSDYNIEKQVVKLVRLLYEQ